MYSTNSKTNVELVDYSIFENKYAKFSTYQTIPRSIELLPNQSLYISKISPVNLLRKENGKGKRIN